MTYFKFKDWGGADFEEALQLAIQDTYDFREWSSEELNLSAEYEDIYLGMVEEVSDVKVIDVRQLPDSRRLVRIEARLVCNFDVFIHKPDYFSVENDPRLSIVNPYWNKRYMRGEIAMSMQSTIRLVLDNSDHDHRKIEVLSVKPMFPDDERLEVTSRRRYRRQSSNQ